MDKIILFGNDGEEIKAVLLRAFSPFRRISCFRNGRPVGTHGKGRKPLMLMDYSCPFFMEPEAAIFIFKKAALSFGGMKLPSGYMPILESNNASAVHMLSGTGAAVVTCGMSARDTLSLSSNDYPTALLSIQRDLRTPQGKILEPADIPVSLSEPTSEYPLLAACGALLLAGHMDENCLHC